MHKLIQQNCLLGISQDVSVVVLYRKHFTIPLHKKGGLRIGYEISSPIASETQNFPRFLDKKFDIYGIYTHVPSS
ncbi:hypothetical protein RN001_002169 [Aquatica leii]|uniref:Uncharacterized protein n=1 Tax=Aquatica leii TaxID=1421715 RepID=A0AAN7SR52_9COLE|nr:hypothetical protein RN001_002169 [Aquatica leii]